MAGRWSILLGLYQVPEACRVEIDVEVDSRSARSRLGDEPDPDGPTRAPASPPRVVAGWVPGDLHVHSTHSADADTPIPVAGLVAAAEAKGLAFMAVTDHNTVSHHAELARLQASTPVRLIPGQEVTTYLGHFNVWGGDDLVDFRIRSAADLDAALAKVEAMGAVASICHPKTVGPPWQLPFAAGFAAMEAWGAPWIWANGESLQAWDHLLRDGRRITAVGGSDIHDLDARPGHHLATPATWVPSGADPLDAIRAGTVVVSEAVDGPVVVSGRDGTHLVARVIGGAGGRLRAVGPSGPYWVADVDDDDAVLDAGPAPKGWGRFELWGPGWFRSGPAAGRLGRLRALTNPLYA
jgi:hypothetical protein